MYNLKLNELYSQLILYIINLKTVKYTHTYTYIYIYIYIEINI